MSNKEHYWGLVPAAGIGKRMGSDIPKQYLRLGKQTILQWTLDKISQVRKIEKIIVVLHPDDTHWQALDLGTTETVTGGAERFHSVLNGLKALEGVAAKNDWVLVHDAVRPCVTVNDINELITSLENSAVGGLLASPVKDTLKQGNSSHHVINTLPRSEYWLAATPQMFRYGLLCEAMAYAIKNKLDITDEASAMETMGHEVTLVEGRSDNIKITNPADLGLVEFLLNQEELSNEM